MVLLLLFLLAGGQAATLPSCENALPPGEGFGGSVTITTDCIWRPQLHFISTLTGQQRPDYPGALTTPTIFYEPAPVSSQAGTLRLLQKGKGSGGQGADRLYQPGHLVLLLLLSSTCWCSHRISTSTSCMGAVNTMVVVCFVAHLSLPTRQRYCGPPAAVLLSNVQARGACRCPTWSLPTSC